MTLWTKNKSAKPSRNRPNQSLEPDSREKPNANEAMLSIKDMMHNMQGKIITKFESIMSEVIKKELTAALKLLEKVVGQFGSILDLERSANEHDNGLATS